VVTAGGYHPVWTPESFIGHIQHVREYIPKEIIAVGLCVEACDPVVTAENANDIWKWKVFTDGYSSFGIWPITATESNAVSWSLLSGFSGWWVFPAVFPIHTQCSLEETGKFEESAIEVHRIFLVFLLLVLLIAFSSHRGLTSTIWSLRTGQSKVGEIGPIAVFIPMYKESEQEVIASCTNFRKDWLRSQSIREAVEIFFVLDTGRDLKSGPFQSLQKICNGLEEDVFLHVPCFRGTCHGIPCQIFLKGESLRPKGKRHSMAFFCNVAENIYTERNKSCLAALCLDADVLVIPNGIESLITDLIDHPAVAMTCGTIVPYAIESDWSTIPSVMCQTAEYHIQNYIIKNSEAFFGAVSCCPGAICLARFHEYNQMIYVHDHISYYWNTRFSFLATSICDIAV